MQSDYLHALLTGPLSLAQPVALFGRGLGGRVALLHALSHPSSVGALVLENVPSGSAAADGVVRSMYSSLVDTAAIYNVDGMAYVAKDPRFAEVCAIPDNREHLLRTPFDFFKMRMSTWAEELAAGGDAAFFPCLGIGQHLLHSLSQPTLAGFLPAGDGAAAGFSTGEGCAALNDCFLHAAATNASCQAGFDSEQLWVESCVAFLSALPAPLPPAPLRNVAATAASTLAGASRTWARNLFGETAGGSPSKDAEADGAQVSPGKLSRSCSGVGGGALGELLQSAASAMGKEEAKAPATPVAEKKAKKGAKMFPKTEAMAKGCVVQ
jgi:pimeloyl-ACP methyl ester carboxylesterase